MDKYLLPDWAGTYYIQSLHKQSDNNYLAIEKVKAVKQISCQKISEEASVEEDSDLGVILSNCWSNGGNDGKLYLYDDVLKSKKELFGSKSSLEKADFIYDLTYYYYSAQNNGFISLTIPAGGDTADIISSGVHSAKIIGQNLEINTYFYNLEYDYETEDKYILKIGDNVYNINTTDRESAKKEALKYLDKMQKYKYVFKQEDNHWYLYDIVVSES